MAPCLVGEGKSRRAQILNVMKIKAGRWVPGLERPGGRQGGLLSVHEAVGRDLNEIFLVTHVLTFF